MGTKGPDVRPDQLAFPIESPNGRRLYPDHIGMTKREFFAAKALQGIRANNNEKNPKHAARDAVEDADALIHELNRTNKQE